MHLEGRRIYLDFRRENNKPVNYLTRLRVSVDIAVPDPADTGAVHHALDRVFIENSSGEAALFKTLEEIRGLSPEKHETIASKKEDPETASKSGESGSVAPPTTPEGERSKPVKVGIVTLGRPISQPDPEYPASAKSAGFGGTVVFAATIGKDGRIKNLRIINFAGSGLDEAAFDAVIQWRYKPYLLDGKPVEVETSITVNFQMR